MGLLCERALPIIESNVLQGDEKTKGLKGVPSRPLGWLPQRC